MPNKNPISFYVTPQKMHPKLSLNHTECLIIKSQKSTPFRNWRKLFGFLSKSIIYHMCSMKDGKKSKSPPLRFVLHWSLLFLQFKSTQNKCSKAFDSKSKRFASSSYTKMHHWYGMLRTECVMSFESAFKKHSASFVSVCSFVCES